MIKRTKQLKIMLSTIEARKLKELADLEGVSVSTLVRQLVRKKYEAETKRRSP